MQRDLEKILKINLVFLLHLLPSFVSLNNYSYALEVDNAPKADYLKKIPKNNFYILGPGDQISLRVSEEARELDSNFVINGEGVAYLKRLRNIYMEGLTIKELTKLLNEEYGKYVINPKVEIRIEKYRPISFYIDGEVESPGQYIINGSFSLGNNYLSSEEIRRKNNTIFPKDEFLYREENESISLNPPSNTTAIAFPTLIDAIRQSRGITANANLREIIVTRKNNLTNGGGRIKTKINLLKVLNLEDQSQNIRILDGDTIFIPKGDNPSSLDIAKAIKSNLNPSFINIYIGGRVELPGKYQINKSSTLNDAIDISGGAKRLKGPTRLIRYDNDGTVDKRNFRYRRNAKRGSYYNPYLKNGDIIYVGKSAFNVASEVLNEVTSPLQSMVSIYGIYKVFD